MDDLSDTLCQVVDPAQLCASCHTDASWRREAERVLGELGGYIHDLNTDPAIYRSLRRTLDRLNTTPAATRPSDPALRLFTPEAARVTEMLVRDCERSGVHLPDDKKSVVSRWGPPASHMRPGLVKMAADCPPRWERARSAGSPPRSGRPSMGSLAT